MVLTPSRSGRRLLGCLILAAGVSGCSLVQAGITSGTGGWAGDQQGMMGGRGWTMGAGTAGDQAPSGVAGTVAAPRVVHIIAGPGDRFSPSDVPVVSGETITFEVTAVGAAVHEFKVGPLEAVKADASGLPEIPAIGMMRTGSLTYTFDGPGAYGFACHEPGHFEAGMWGTVTIAD